MESERRELHDIAPLLNRSTFENINLHKRFGSKVVLLWSCIGIRRGEDAKLKAHKSVSAAGSVADPKQGDVIVAALSAATIASFL